jgi:hypothetical protein
MTENDAAKILLVRSVEETDKNAFPPERLEEALAAPANDMRPSSWFLKRACYLLDTVPLTYSSILRLARLPQGWNIPLYALAFVLGLGTNYLGPVEKIPLILNPLMALVAWNLLVYTVAGVSLLRSGFKDASPSSPEKHPKDNGYPSAPSESISRNTVAPAPWILRVLLPTIWISVHKFTLRFHATAKQAACFVKVAGRFWTHWAEAAEPLLVARWKLLLHSAGLFLTAGAVAGMYIRGVFLKYEVIWTSTFIKSENTVARLVDTIFAPAISLARIAGRDLRADIDMGRLMSPAGDPAASWIHLFALTALLVIIVPRAILAALQWLHISRAGNNVQIDFDDYFASLIRPQIGALMAREIELASHKFSEAMANFVCARLYDASIVPELAQFRETGGKINDLRERIKKRCEEFTAEISVYAGAAVKELETSLAKGLERILSAVQQDFRFAPTMRQSLLGGLEVFPRNEFDHPVSPIGESFTGAISIAVSASMAVALGTLAGGFGESLEVAIIVALFGTTGPVGFLIGAVIGLIVGGGAWWFGRDKITEQIENISLPGTFVRMALWQSRFDNLVQEGREKCHELVKNRVSELLSPLSPQIASEVWTGIEGLWKGKANTGSTGPSAS